MLEGDLVLNSLVLLKDCERAKFTVTRWWLFSMTEWKLYNQFFPAQAFREWNRYICNNNALKRATEFCNALPEKDISLGTSCKCLGSSVFIEQHSLKYWPQHELSESMCVRRLLRMELNMLSELHIWSLVLNPSIWKLWKETAASS